MSNALVTAGTIVAIGTTATLPAGDTFAAIGEVVSFDGPGGSAGLIDVSHLGSTSREKRKGLKDNGQFTMVVNKIFDNAGQMVVSAAQNDNDPYNFKVTYTDGTIHDFKVLVMEFKIVGGGVDDALRGNITLEITGDVTETAPA